MVLKTTGTIPWFQYNNWFEKWCNLTWDVCKIVFDFVSQTKPSAKNRFQLISRAILKVFQIIFLIPIHFFPGTQQPSSFHHLMELRVGSHNLWLPTLKKWKIIWKVLLVPFTNWFLHWNRDILPIVLSTIKATFWPKINDKICPFTSKILWILWINCQWIGGR